MKNIYTKEFLEPIIKISANWTDACKKLGVGPHGGSRMWAKKSCDKLGIDYSHFTNHNRSDFVHKPLEHYLVKNCYKISSHMLKLRLIKEGIKEYKCENCGITEWMEQPTPLELDHINGDHYDNRLENLRILCPNCHSLTDNNSVKKTKYGKKIYTCPRCGGPKMYEKSIYCNHCCSRAKEKPLPLEEVKEYVMINGFLAASRKYGLSDNGIRKRLKSANLL